MLLMIFVNDLWSLSGIPAWLEHTKAAEDGMGLADTVFPAFLFITGMSIPLAIDNRRSKGDSDLNIVFHIVIRTLALLVMGLYLVNGEYLNESATGLPRGIWNSICCTCFILLWNGWSTTSSRKLIAALKTIAIITLLFLAWIYRGDNNGVLSRFSTWWWGILGLIGWAYFICAFIYAFSGRKIVVLSFAWLLFIFLCIGSHADWLHSAGLIKFLISPFGEGAMPAFVCGGVITTMIFINVRKQGFKKLFGLLLLMAILLLAAGFYTRLFWGISKIRATPAWVLICSGITIIVFLAIYWITEIRSKSEWFNIIKPAGTNTLLCYLMPYYAYAMVNLLQISLPAILLTGSIGLIKSFIFSLLMVIITGWLGRAGIRLKL